MIRVHDFNQTSPGVRLAESQRPIVVPVPPVLTSPIYGPVVSYQDTRPMRTDGKIHESTWVLKTVSDAENSWIEALRFLIIFVDTIGSNLVLKQVERERKGPARGRKFTCDDYIGKISTEDKAAVSCALSSSSCIRWIKLKMWPFRFVLWTRYFD